MAIKKILGFDVSSSCIGYAVLSFNEKTKQIKFILADHIKPIKDGTLIERLANTRDQIKTIIEQIKPDFIAIEDVVLFIRNLSTAQTITILATFNRMIGLTAFDYLGHPPAMYPVIGIRHRLKPGTEFPAKEDMPNLIAWHLNIDFPWEYGKKGNIKVENYDRADAVAVALMHVFALGGKTSPKNAPPKMTPKTIKKTKSKKKVKKNGN